MSAAITHVRRHPCCEMLFDRLVEQQCKLLSSGDKYGVWRDMNGHEMVVKIPSEETLSQSVLVVFRHGNLPHFNELVLLGFVGP